MEYIYGIITKNGNVYENLKTIDSIHSNLTGYITTIIEFPDGLKIEDKCRVIRKYASKESDGLCYDWYIIDNHYRETDTSLKMQKMIDKVNANLDYISMMSGINIPKEDGV